MRFTHLIYLFIFSALFLTACGGEDDTPATDATIAGEWNIESYTLDINSTTSGQGINETITGSLAAVQPIDFTVTFITDPNEGFSDGSLTFEGDLTTSSGQTFPLGSTFVLNPFDSRATWSLDGNSLRFAPAQGAEPYSMNIVSLTETEMILEWVYEQAVNNGGFTSTTRNDGRVVLGR